MTRRRSLWRDGILTFSALSLLALFAFKMNDRPETVRSGSFYAIDGDTLDQAGARLRLLGIDAPESRQQCERNGADWPCGLEARAALVKLLGRGPVECRGSRYDRYGRLLVVCRAGEIDLNGAMVSQGMAVAYGGYAAEESQARAARLGVWAGRFERPQDYRRAQAGERDGSIAGLSGLVRRMAGWN